MLHGGQAVTNRYNDTHTVEAGQSVTLACCGASCVDAPSEPIGIQLTLNGALALTYRYGITTPHNERCRLSDDLSAVTIDHLLVTHTRDDYVCTYEANLDDTDIFTHSVQVYSKWIMIIIIVLR